MPAAMELAPPDRPAWTEVVAILVACLLAFVVIAKVDHAAARRVAERARAAQADRAERAAATTPRRTARLGEQSPLGVPVEGAWSAGSGRDAETPRHAAARAGGASGASPELFALAACAMVVTAAGAVVLSRRRWA